MTVDKNLFHIRYPSPLSCAAPLAVYKTHCIPFFTDCKAFFAKNDGFFEKKPKGEQKPPQQPVKKAENLVKKAAKRARERSEIDRCTEPDSRQKEQSEQSLADRERKKQQRQQKDRAEEQVQRKRQVRPPPSDHTGDVIDCAQSSTQRKREQKLPRLQSYGKFHCISRTGGAGSRLRRARYLHRSARRSVPPH